MEKIPVGRTIVAAYSFALGHLATIIGLMWLPLALLLVVEYVAIRDYLDGTIAALSSGNRFAVYGPAAFLYGVMAVAVLVQSMVIVPVLRQALGLRVKGAYVHLALGPAELRTFAALLSYNFILLVLVAILRFGWTVLTEGALMLNAQFGASLGVSGVEVMLWSALGLQYGLVAVYLVLFVRLSFFLAPIAVAERRIDLIRSWSLTHGNFWRGLVVMACVGLPVWLLYLSVQLGLVGFATLGDTLSALPMAARFAGSPGLAAAQAHALMTWLPWLFASWLLIQPLSLGLTAGAAAAAYRALVPEPPAVSTPDADALEPAAVG